MQICQTVSVQSPLNTENDFLMTGEKVETFSFSPESVTEVMKEPTALKAAALLRTRTPFTKHLNMQRAQHQLLLHRRVVFPLCPNCFLKPNLK